MNILCRFNLAFFLVSVFLFAFAWFVTARSVARADREQFTISSAHETSMLGSLAQICEKAELEDEDEKLTDTSIFSALVLFHIPTVTTNCCLSFQRYCVSPAEATQESIFIRIRNLRI
jgi:hypothetical protein